MISDNTSQLHSFVDTYFDNEEHIRDIFQSNKEIAARLSNGFKVIRTKPCADCGCVNGLYSDIALGMHKYLTEEEKEEAIKYWDCHNGGRCEGAKLIITSGNLNNI